MASLLVMAFNVNTNSMNVNAIDFGLISKDTNIGSIDTSTLFNCVGAAITCDNDNTVNNNISMDNGASQPNEPPTCEECLTNYLTPEEIAMLVEEGLIGVEPYCAHLTDLTPEQLVAELNGFEGFMVSEGIDPDTAEAVVDCLFEIFQ